MRSYSILNSIHMCVLIHIPIWYIYWKIILKNHFQFHCSIIGVHVKVTREKIEQSTMYVVEVLRSGSNYFRTFPRYVFTYTILDTFHVPSSSSVFPIVSYDRQRRSRKHSRDERVYSNWRNRQGKHSGILLS